jgi:glycosyltransferase involved in cell wall biosynthesis
MNSSDLGKALAAAVHGWLEELVLAHFPSWRIPSVFAGHPVGPDVRADLAFTLGFLHGCGVDRVADLAIPEAIARTLRPIDGPATHTFYAYRVAETLGTFGPFAGNPILHGWSEAERQNLALACDSSDWAKVYDQGLLPRNYAAVLARCEEARARLGLATDDTLHARMLEATRDLLDAHPRGFLDDSRARSGRFDIYGADVYLFTEPLSEALGETWRRGAHAALDWVERVVDRRGHAVTWGRSSGALAACLTVELGALAQRADLDTATGRWVALAERAFAHFPRWMSGGVITAHQYRSPYAYRGPARRLQMTLDALGKLAWAARELGALDPPVAPTETEAHLEPRDEWIAFESDPPAGVWSHRSERLAFVLPVVGATSSDYLPAPRNPGLLEVPVDSPLATGTPFAIAKGERFVAGHRPASLRKVQDGLEVEYAGWVSAGQLEVDGKTARLEGERSASFAVRGGRLEVHERWHFPEPPEALALQIAETRGRPLSVRFECDAPHAVSTIDTSGLAEYRSFWSELPRVHQVDVEPDRSVELRWSVAPLLRVTSTEVQHHYHRSLYDPLAGRVSEKRFAHAWVAQPDRAARELEDVDLFHLHWPEWIAAPEPDVHRRFLDVLRAAEVRIVWTQHNLVPHREHPAFEEIYGLWAAAADAAIHHSEWGMARMRARYAFSPRTLHRVIPHGHFGNLMADVARVDRRAAEAELGLAPCRARLGVVGAPRDEKRTGMLMEAFARSAPEDFQLLVLSLAPGETVPDDPRILALPYEHVDRDVYNRRLATIDCLAIPIEGDRYLTTGQFADAIGLGIPALTSDWPFLAEMLGDAGIVYGRGRDDLERCLAALDADAVARAARASRALQARFDWRALAEETLSLLEAVGTAKL